MEKIKALKIIVKSKGHCFGHLNCNDCPVPEECAELIDRFDPQAGIDQHTAKMWMAQARLTEIEKIEIWKKLK